MVKKHKIGNYLIYKNTGIGIIIDMDTIEFKNVETPQITLDILHKVNESNFLKKERTICRLPLGTEIKQKIREPIEFDDWLKVLQSIKENTSVFSPMILLEENFKIDLFDVNLGLKNLFLLYDYLYHARDKNQEICENYYVMYENAVSQLAIELETIFKIDRELFKDILEIVLFYNHLYKQCPKCKDSEKYLESCKKIADLENIFTSLQNPKYYKKSTLKKVIRDTQENYPNNTIFILK